MNEIARAQHPFRFGVQVARPRPAAEWRETARRAEALGYDVFVMPDHFGRQFAIGPALATVAAVTSTIRIGTLVWQNDLRHPALLAQEAATLDVLSDGRFEFGIGAGGSVPIEYEWTGIPFASPRSRVDRLGESIKVLKALATDEPFSHTGANFTFSDFQSQPKPLQKPHPPILIAAGGKRMLALAAREADIVGIVPRMLPTGGFSENDSELEISIESFEEKAALIRTRAEERAGALELNILVQMVAVEDDRPAAIERLTREHEIADKRWFDSPLVLVGSVTEIVERILEIRERTGISYFVVFEPAIDVFAPVIAALAAYRS